MDRLVFPKLPPRVTSAIKLNNGIIMGSFALHSYMDALELNPKWQPNDVDVAVRASSNVARDIAHAATLFGNATIQRVYVNHKVLCADPSLMSVVHTDQTTAIRDALANITSPSDYVGALLRGALESYLNYTNLVNKSKWDPRLADFTNILAKDDLRSEQFHDAIHWVVTFVLPDFDKSVQVVGVFCDDDALVTKLEKITDQPAKVLICPGITGQFTFHVPPRTQEIVRTGVARVDEVCSVGGRRKKYEDRGFRFD